MYVQVIQLIKIKTNPNILVLTIGTEWDKINRASGVAHIGHMTRMDIGEVKA